MKRIRKVGITCLLAAMLPGVLQATHQDHPTGPPLEQGLWWLYHLQYEKARQMFTEYTAAHPHDPSGYFYKTAADWWQLAQQFDRKLREVEARLGRDYQDTVRVADAILSSDKIKDSESKGKACLYEGGAQGLKGRWLVTQRQWIKAYFLGKNGQKMLKKALHYDPHLYDAYLGLGIYDYYTDTLPGIQKALAALLIHGDRKRGLQELQWAIEKGEHARVEAMMFLIQIYTWEERTPAKALPYAQALHREFPKSPAMSLAEIMDYYQLRDWDKVQAEALDYLERLENVVPYYQREGVYPAWNNHVMAAF